MRARWNSAAVFAALWICGCTEDRPSQVIEVVSSSGRVTALFTPTPDPPVVGQNALDIVLNRTSADQPLAAESITVGEVELWMPAHGHGAASPPTVDAIRQGPESDGGEDSRAVVIQLSSVRYLMAGRWEVHLTTEIDGEPEVFLATQEVW